MRRFLIGVVTVLGAGLCAFQSASGVEGRYVVKPLVQKKGKQLPAGPLYWRLAAADRGDERDRQIRHLPHLLVNVSDTVRYVVNGVCESQGVREIAQILKRSDFEEMWAFLPGARRAGECQWHEIGREERSESGSANLRVDMTYLEELMAGNAELHVYHFHPLKYFECASRPGCPRAAAPGHTRSFDQRWIADLVFSMPSPSDIHFMMDVTSRFHRRHGTLASIKHKVVTPYGVVDYELTEAGLAKFDAEQYGRSEGLYIAWVAASRLADDQIAEVIKEHPGDIVAAVRRLAQTLNSKLLRVSYSTFAEEVDSQSQGAEGGRILNPWPVTRDR